MQNLNESTIVVGNGEEGEMDLAKEIETKSEGGQLLSDEVDSYEIVYHDEEDGNGGTRNTEQHS